MFGGVFPRRKDTESSPYKYREGEGASETKVKGEINSCENQSSIYSLINWHTSD